MCFLPRWNEELDRLVKTGVLSKLEYSEWAAPLINGEKKSKDMRVCPDFFTGLNAALKNSNYPLPCPEVIFSRLNGGKFFLKTDFCYAYSLISFEEVSSKLFWINTQRGLYKFDRLPFRVKVAPAIFQQVMDTMLSSLDFEIAYLGDILMKSKSINEHNEHVHKAFTKIRDYGFKIKETKCDFSWKNQIPESHY